MGTEPRSSPTRPAPPRPAAPGRSLRPGCLQAFYIIRFHSFYPWHKFGDYRQLCNEQDLAMLPWVQEFKYGHGHGPGHAWGVG